MRKNGETSSRCILSHKRSDESRVLRQIGGACPRNTNERRENYAEFPCRSLRAAYITAGHFSPSLFLFSLVESFPYGSPLLAFQPTCKSTSFFPSQTLSERITGMGNVVNENTILLKQISSSYEGNSKSEGLKEAHLISKFNLISFNK